MHTHSYIYAHTHTHTPTNNGLLLGPNIFLREMGEKVCVTKSQIEGIQQTVLFNNGGKLIHSPGTQAF